MQTAPKSSQQTSTDPILNRLIQAVRVLEEIKRIIEEHKVLRHQAVYEDLKEVFDEADSIITGFKDEIKNRQDSSIQLSEDELREALDQ